MAKRIYVVLPRAKPKRRGGTASRRQVVRDLDKALLAKTRASLRKARAEHSKTKALLKEAESEVARLQGELAVANYDRKAALAAAAVLRSDLEKATSTSGKGWPSKSPLANGMGKGGGHQLDGNFENGKRR